VNTLTNAFRCLIAADRESLVPALYLCIDRIAPSYCADVAPMSVGHSILSKAIMVGNPLVLQIVFSITPFKLFEQRVCLATSFQVLHVCLPMDESQEATGVQKSALREKSIAFGDLGDAAVAVKASQRTLSFGRAASVRTKFMV
jgi:hypothetical protein